ncbi:hypothetical protein [Stenotrophomonas acidaminiphila]|uniref:hypothetical protein n=1 Tax=Stenotrophomonas acidaminiphila TaxID=128780 RepID=UPI0028ADC742|nr:hypothetical protein [Stenotrophomonas acidaminiphila]
MEYEQLQRLHADLDVRIASLRVMVATIIGNHPQPEQALAPLEHVAAHCATLLDDAADVPPIQRARAQAYVAELQELKRLLARTRNARAGIVARRAARSRRQQEQDHDLDR